MQPFHVGRDIPRWTSTVSKPILLEHRHLGDDDPDGLTDYDDATVLQDEHRARFLAWKSLPDQVGASSYPMPCIFSFESTPTFTLGRRQGQLAQRQLDQLEQDLHVQLPHRVEPIDGLFTPNVRNTHRGGLTTYHGPGQLVIWPVLDMHSPLYPKYNVASYAAHLESTTQQLLAELFGIKTYISRDEPGVWVDISAGQPRKIAALGVHHRRYVTALGIAVNIDIPVTGGEDVNPWARFVPCGLDGKLVTSVAAELGLAGTSMKWNLASLASQWVKSFEVGLLDAGKRGLGEGR